MIIIGAGMSGLMAGVLWPEAQMVEARPKLLQGHLAILRTRSDAVSKITGIPFRRAVVQKALWYRGEEHSITPRFNNLYSAKVSGTIAQRSITDLKETERFIPPVDFALQLEAKCKSRIQYSHPIGLLRDLPEVDGPIISTVPMPVMVDLIRADENNISRPDEFNYRSIFVNRFEIKNCDVYSTIYYPGPYTPIYRASLNGNILIIESTSEIESTEDITMVLESFGLECYEKQTQENHLQKYGKIAPIDTKIRKNFIATLTLKYGIYSLGRYAIWKPGVGLDAVLDDIFVIKRLINQGFYSVVRNTI